MNLLLSEWTKLRTTKTFWWTTALFFIFAIAWAVLMAKTATIPEPDPNLPPELQQTGSPLTSDTLTAVIWMMGLPVLLIQAIMMVTTEYRHKTHTITMTATPVRWKVALVKLLLYVVLAVIFVELALLISFGLGELLAKPEVADLYDPFDEMAKRALWTFPLATALIVVFAQGMGWLLRQTAGAIALSLILYMGIDGLLQMIPKVGEKIVNFAPFTSLNNFIMEIDVESAPWGVTGNLVVFAVWAVALWLLGLFMLERRDV